MDSKQPTIAKLLVFQLVLSLLSLIRSTIATKEGFFDFFLVSEHFVGYFAA